jgi:RNA polymerase sigma-70 factor (ECF subfamily)
VPLDEADQLAAPGEHEAAEASLDIATVLAQLPARTRALIKATRIEGVGMAEAGRRAGMTEAAVKVAVHRGLKRLAEVFGRARSP